MPAENFIKKNLVLILGLALPVVLMGFFFIASTLPQTLTDPPTFDMVFSVQDYNSGQTALPVSVNFVVRDGVLKAQYVALKSPGNYSQWRKLYLYDTKTQKVRELPFGFPPDMDKITGTREDIVDATKSMKIDQTQESPDGYSLAHGEYSHSGLVNAMFWGGHYANEPRLRKGGSSVKLVTPGTNAPFYYGNIQFIGWVKP